MFESGEMEVELKVVWLRALAGRWRQETEAVVLEPNAVFEAQCLSSEILWEVIKFIWLYILPRKCSKER